MANTYTLIASSTASSGAVASFDFTSIPATYTDLLVRISARCSATNGGYNVYSLFLSLNGSTANFSATQLGAAGSAGSPFSYNSNPRQLGWMPDAAATASVFGNTDVHIFNYTSSNYKSFSTDGATEANSSGGAYMVMGAGLWSNTAAINQVTITPETGNFVQYSSAYLYGIKNS